MHAMPPQLPQVSGPSTRPSGRLAQWRALSAAHQRTLLGAVFWMPLFWLGLRYLGLPRFQALLQRITVTRDAAMTLPDIQALGELVNIAARHTLAPLKLGDSVHVWWCGSDVVVLTQ